MRRLSAVLLFASALLSACSDTNDPEVISADEIQGTWIFNRLTTSGCAPNLTLTITEVREASGHGYNFSGTWQPAGEPVQNIVGGNVEADTGAFTVSFTVSPSQRIEGIMNANGTATAFWQGGNCTQELAGVRQ